jgi:hypothetical protein
MANFKVLITRTSSQGLQVKFNNSFSTTAQVGIGWNGGWGGVAMSIQQAKELQCMLEDVLLLADQSQSSQEPCPLASDHMEGE